MENIDRYAPAAAERAAVGPFCRRRGLAADSGWRRAKESLGASARKPDLGRVAGDLEVDEPPSMVTNPSHGVEQLRCHGRDHEHVDRGNVRHVVARKVPTRGAAMPADRGPGPE